MNKKFKFLLEELLVAMMRKDHKACESIQSQIDELEDESDPINVQEIRIQSKQIVERARARVN